MRGLKPLIQISYKQCLLFAIFLVFYELLTYVANDMIMPGMQQVIDTFHAPTSAIASSVTLFMLGGSSLQFLIGPMSDAYGRRKLMFMGVIIFLFSTFLLSISTSMHAFLVERFIQGMGICFISTVGYATLQEIFNDTDAVKLTSIMSSISILAPLLGPLAGTIIVLDFGWRMIFSLITLATVFAFWGLWKYMPESVGVTKLDGQKIEAHALEFKTTFHNYKKLLSNKSFMLQLLICGLMGTPCMIWIALSPVMIISHAHKSLYEYSLWQIPMFSAFVFANHLLQRWVETYELKKLMQSGVSIVIISLFSMLISLALFGENYLSLIPMFILYFFGYATAISSIYRQLYNLSGVAKGTTAALISLAVMLIQAAGIESANYQYNHASYQALSILFAIIASMILGLMILTKYCQKTTCAAV